MKKLLLATLVAGLVSVSAMADTGTVNQIRIKDTGVVMVKLLLEDGTTLRPKDLVGTPEAIKMMLAAVMTAKASGDMTVTAFGGTVDGLTGWKTIILE